MAIAGAATAETLPAKPARLDSIVASTAAPAGVVLHFSSPVTPSAFAVPAVPPQPPRIAIDLPNTVLGPGIKPPAGSQATVRRIRFGQRDPSTVRVVLDLDHTTPFRIDAQGTTIRITIVEPSAEAVAAPTVPKATPQNPPAPPKEAQTAKASTPAPNRWIAKRRPRGRPVYLDYDPKDFKMP